MSEPSPVLALRESLRSGATVRTEIGLFFRFTMPAVDARNPSTGELIEGLIRARHRPVFVPAATTLAALPADATAASPEEILQFLRRQMGRWMVPEHRHIAEAIEVPTGSTVEIALGTIAERVLVDLRSKGRATVRGFGAFAPKTAGVNTTVGFEPGKDFVLL